MSELAQILLVTLLAGLAMPVGALLAAIEHIRPKWLETELRHGIIAFGGGALLSAVALVLVPQGTRNLSLVAITLCFSAGGVAFMLLDRLLAKHKTSASQLLAMVSDFVPEALALGATFTISHEIGFLLAGIIALQNLPEGFNAFREIKRSTGFKLPHIIGAFLLIALLGPVAGFVGYQWLADYPQVISAIMLFAGGGILYIVFEDIAPQAILKKHWAPPLGAVFGFLLGVIAEALVRA